MERKKRWKIKNFLMFGVRKNKWKKNKEKKLKENYD